MRLFFAFIVIIFIGSCQQPVAYVQQPVGVVAPVAVAQSNPYTVYQDAYGNPATVYYTDPYTHASYWLEYALFMNMWNSPNRYTMIHSYYDGHRSYITSRNSYYSSNYRNVYRPSSPRPGTGSGYRQSSPSPSGNRASVPSSGYRPSSPSPSYRPSSPTPTRSSSPSSSYRPSSPGRRH